MLQFTKSAVAALGLAATLALPATGMAATINFNGANSHERSVTQDGFNARGDNSYSTLGGAYWCSPACAYNGTNYFWSYGNDVIVTSTSGALFSLTSFDASESHSGVGYEVFSPTSIRVTGTYADGATVAAEFALDGINDAMGPLIDFQTFSLPVGFANLSSVVFTPVGGPVRYYGLDNIVLNGGANVGAVPEPASPALVAVALALLGGGMARRARRGKA